MATDGAAQDPTDYSRPPEARPTEPISEPQSPLQPTVEEAAALIGYAANNGIHNEYVDELCRKIRGLHRSVVLQCSDYAAYAALCKLTAPISGASLVDSDSVDRITRPVRLTTQITFAAI